MYISNIQWWSNRVRVWRNKIQTWTLLTCNSRDDLLLSRVPSNRLSVCLESNPNIVWLHPMQKWLVAVAAVAALMTYRPCDTHDRHPDAVDRIVATWFANLCVSTAPFYMHVINPFCNSNSIKMYCFHSEIDTQNKQTYKLMPCIQNSMKVVTNILPYKMWNNI